ncbi:transposase [Paenibacillus sp. FSL M7-1046]|uniref:transposase n=1 Tax=Paenibacillus sp. FSL M7-1046 TaxID=2975315 RepID=UPI0030FA0400
MAAWGTPRFLSRINVSTWVDAPRTDRCSNRCLSGKRFNILKKHIKRNHPLVKWSYYTAEGCPLKERCTKAAGNREVVVSLERLRYQEQARQTLRSEESYALSVQRMTEPESVFGQLKNNRGFWPFCGWLSLAHNLLKQAANDQKHRAATLQ